MKFKRILERVLDYLSGQWIVDWIGANGGHVVVLRSVFVGTVLTLLVVSLQALIEPARTGPVSLHGLQSQLTDLGAIIGAIFAGVYAALYSRFVSQWAYLAGVYNMIKQAEAASGCSPLVIAQWKAGYIEDAETLHLLGKSLVAPIVKAWAAEPEVERAFVTHTHGGQPRLDKVRKKVDRMLAE